MRTSGGFGSNETPENSNMHDNMPREDSHIEESREGSCQPESMVTDLR
jgi:hypothetical protein